MNQSIEKKSRGGARPGAGAKKGSKSKKTLEREAVLAAFRLRAMSVADQLLSAQLSLAKGQSFLYCIKTLKNGKKSERQKPVLVTNENVILKYLDGKLDNEEDEYYYITAKEPQNPAIDSILDRTFGKATQPTDVTSQGEQIKSIIYLPAKPDGMET